MKHFFITISILLAAGIQLSAQDTAKVKKADTFRHFKTWRISQLLASPDTIPADTAHLNFMDHNQIDLFSIANSFNANLGSPIQSKIYTKRPEGSDFLFDDAYKPYIMDIKSATFYDVKFPFTNLTYRTGGSSYRKEDNVKFTFSASPSKKSNFGLDLDYMNAIGEYPNQAVNRFAGDIFGRYHGKHYSAYVYAATNNHKNYESGGFNNLEAIDDATRRKLVEYVNLTGYSTFNKKQLYYNHSYNIGFNRQVKDAKDSIRLEYVPITHFGHTIKYDELKKRYYEPSVVTNFYDTTYTKRKITNDTAAVRELSNAFYINLDEKFNKWMKFGLTGFVENEIQQFTYLQDTILSRTLKSSTRVGGVLSKSQGTAFTYDVSGNIYLVGYKLGEFHLEGKANGNFKLWKENILLSAYTAIRNEEPSFFLQHYHSNHFKWDNHFDKIYRTTIGGIFSLPTRKTLLKIDIENAKNVVYFNEKALPEQHKSNIQIVSADLKQDFSFSKFTLENHVVYQLSSNNDVIPLPTFSLFHNFYYLNTWFKVLKTQLGVNVRMHTAYYAPQYMPATGQFYVQKETRIGNYPLMNLYANFHLKQARFYFEYYHINHLFMKGDYFSMPNYPLNPNIFKMGLSWNFYN
ncbi:MAG: putative porin [Paludibacteraceae bacterium]